VGIVAGLVFGTRVGAITVGPSLFIATLIARRFRAFPDFAPRWRGPGPLPPGYRW
jgi:hypothetical protein